MGQGHYQVTALLRWKEGGEGEGEGGEKEREC